MEGDTKVKVNEVLSRHISKREELIPILQAIQEQFGYLPPEAMQQTAEFLHISDSTVFGVAAFYALFKFVPTGKKMLKVCRGTACHVRGAPRILDEVQKRLNIKPGETTDDLEYSLEAIACFGSCALAPVMVVDETVYGRMTPSKADEILDTRQ
ncbi:MAG: NADH-quinone oxidoreductase subunit NuoE [Dehalococcoidia bacterium]|nr:MAG: NADH-quinone oxidoreductase subunit NuoE [Dehalococcoidia bacterium]